MSIKKQLKMDAADYQRGYELPLLPWADKIIWSRNGTKDGRTTGATRPCQLEGCTGQRVVVRWCDGSTTYPCTKGLLHIRGNIFQIS